MPSQVLGIAFEDRHVAMVRLKGHAKAYEVTLALREPLESLDNPEQQAILRTETVRRLVEAHGLQGDTVLASLPAHRGILRNLALPFRDQRRIRQTINFALDEHMPFEPEDVVVDFCRLSMQRKTRDTRILAAAVPKRAIADGLALLAGAGVEPAVLDLDVFALANAAVLGGSGLAGKTAVLYPSGDQTLLTLLQDGEPVFARSLAQRLPQEREADETEKLGRQVQHTLYACEDSFQQPYEPELLLLLGPHEEELARLGAGLQAFTGIQAKAWQLEAPGYRQNGAAMQDQHPGGYAIALGTALRGLHRRFRGFNLRRGEFAPHSGLRELRGRLVAAGVLALVVAGLGLGNLYLRNHFKAQRLAQVQQAVAEVFRDIAPGTRMVQPLAQARQQMQDLQRRLRAFGGLTGAQLSSLQILRELSAGVPPELKVEVDNLTINEGTIELNANASTYDNVVRLQRVLAASPLLDQVTINNTRQGTNNSVQFRLSLRASDGREDAP